MRLRRRLVINKKPETLPELIARLDSIYTRTRNSGKWREHEPKSDFVKAWPRIFEAIQELEKERDEILEALKRTYTLLPPERVHLATEGTAILAALTEEEEP